ncbi:MAG TPA: alpha/beta fold hydrolase [Puia sp.]|nr:alpha/beta fold hydrolase [Puia sp.]
MKISQKLALRYARARINILSLTSTRKAAVRAFRLFCTPQLHLAGEGSPLFAKGRSLSFRFQGHTVRGRCWLPTEPPTKKVLVAHGFESSSLIFEAYIAALLQKGFEVVAFDAPAHGRSGGKRVTLPKYVGMLRIIEQEFGPFDAYIGHSLGGLALALFLETSPHNESTRLVLIAPAVETATALQTFARVLHLQPGVVREIDDYIQETSGQHVAWYSLRRALHNIHAGILYLQDKDDKITPIAGAQTIRQDGHPNIRFVFTSGLGHRRICADTESMTQIIGFL